MSGPIDMRITAKSRLRNHINSTITLLLIVCLAGLLAWLSVRYQWQTDWTQTGRHTLSQASREVLAKMDGRVEITAYARKIPRLRQTIENLVGRYQRIKSDITLHFVNPDTVPDEVRNAGISINGEMLIHYQGRTEHVRSDQEEELTNALERLIRGAEYWLAFVEGHGERNPLGEEDHDLSIWAKYLATRGFKIQPLNLAEFQTIPDNTGLLVIASPRIDFLPGEVAAMSTYLDRGGNLLWLADPGDMYGLQSLAEQLGIRILAGLVLDPASNMIGIKNQTMVLSTPRLYPEHPVTRNFSYTTLFPTVAALEVSPKPTWKKTSLLSSSNHTWRETEKLEGEADYHENEDQIGPLEIGISLERTIETETEKKYSKQRIVVIGDGDFLSNAYIGNGGNLDLAMRLANWLSGHDNFINIPAKTVNDAHFEAPPWTFGVIWFGFIFLLPAGLVGLGIRCWWRRKSS